METELPVLWCSASTNCTAHQPRRPCKVNLFHISFVSEKIKGSYVIWGRQIPVTESFGCPQGKEKSRKREHYAPD